ncbi:6-phosphogluconolactonase [Nitrosospira briensis]|uniref:6-phosphogluconolactonase n=1 Tax=Nitrosospira briensis TaxID=35799 RepID=UPI0008EC9A98|nr:6-phosphogluconolactonase [Nitrosospira briensis]SFO22634.1 6-phosphogluconolactonase [Nitrosospira briensis]
MISINTGQYRWHEFPDLSALHEAALGAILDSAALAIQERGRFNLVLAGGETPRGVYNRLKSVPTDWSAWHIYFGDERCMPPTEFEWNFRMAGEAWLDHVAIPPNQIHAIPGGIRADKAADEYAQTLRGVGMFDLTLLGIGEDGHTASLFPGNDWGIAPDSPDTLAVFNSPKRPPQRVSLSAARLNRSRQIIFLVAGASKHKAVAKWRAGENIPARAIMCETGVDVLTESALLLPKHSE